MRLYKLTKNRILQLCHDFDIIDDSRYQYINFNGDKILVTRDKKRGQNFGYPLRFRPYKITNRRLKISRDGLAVTKLRKDFLKMVISF